MWKSQFLFFFFLFAQNSTIFICMPMLVRILNIASLSNVARNKEKIEEKKVTVKETNHKCSLKLFSFKLFFALAFILSLGPHLPTKETFYAMSLTCIWTPRLDRWGADVASTKIVSNWSVCSNDLKKYRFFFMETNKFDSFPLVLVTVICEIEHVILATVTWCDHKHSVFKIVCLVAFNLLRGMRLPALDVAGA